MIARSRALPLGVDLGSSRVRVALAVEEPGGSVRIAAVASRETVSCGNALLPALVEEMLAELGTRERRCVISVGAPVAALRVVAFPRMTWTERSRAARFEARRFAEWDIEAIPTHVRAHLVDGERGLYAVGAAQAKIIEMRRAVLREAGLRAIAVDHDAFALRRALPFADAIIDIGLERSTLHAYDGVGVRSTHVPVGGATVTQGIARDLLIDAGSAERRKRILGSAGAGVGARDEVVHALAAAIDRIRPRSAITRVALTGNGSRLPGIAASLEAASGAIVELPVAQGFPTDAYPPDVVRSAAPDWALAIALATWARAS